MLLQRLFRQTTREWKIINSLNPIANLLSTGISSDFLPNYFRFRSHTSKAAVQGLLKVTYLTPDNESIVCHVKKGSNLLDIAHAHDIELEGACLNWDLHILSSSKKKMSRYIVA